MNALHFYTKTSIDTLDYSGDGLNEGSKVVIAAAGNIIRELCNEIPSIITNNYSSFLVMSDTYHLIMATAIF